jgi:hypothetical protein
MAVGKMTSESVRELKRSEAARRSLRTRPTVAEWGRIFGAISQITLAMRSPGTDQSPECSAIEETFDRRPRLNAQQALSFGRTEPGVPRRVLSFSLIELLLCLRMRNFPAQSH